MIKEYQTIICLGTDKLNEEVNNLIKQGWQPIGGVSISHVVMPLNGKDLHTTQCAQSMVR